ncbi:hypothetical protein QBZ16_001572 [Prototheca wickerhamii]|uniref:SUN domain-containing protein n=1 Tax=Prototheca wickerhamii TaxID=3111 RepID=A0AAD9ID84_PROWI|nr:hypothetical protein QBZ16_001572 [Prototheca wickerhamii]
MLHGANIDQNNEAAAPLRRFELVQNELYSSRVKAFEVYVRESHPRQEAGANLTAGLESTTWKLAGNFTAQNQRGVQYFRLEDKGWVRYLLVRWRTHHGSEPVCAINGIAVYGTAPG